MVFSAFVTPATPRTPAGGRACGTPRRMAGLVFRPRLIRRCARIRAVSAAYVRKFYWKSPHKKMPWLVLPAPSGPRAKKKAQSTAPARGDGGRGMSVGVRGVLQTALMGLITALGQRNRPKWTSRAVSRGGFFATTQTKTTGFLVRVEAPQWSAWWVGAREGGSRGRDCTGRSFRYARLLGANQEIAGRERPRVSARPHVAQRDARAPGPAPTHPTTRPDAYLDVPSLLERTASARCRLLVHVDKPPVLSEARRWLS